LYKTKTNTSENVKLTILAKMENLYLYIAIFATLAVLLIGLLFLKTSSSLEEPSEARSNRRRAAVPNRDEDGQIITTGPGPRGRRGGPRIRRQAVEEAAEIVDAAEDDVDRGSDDEDEGHVAREFKTMGKKKTEKMEAKAEKKRHREAELLEREDRKKRMERDDEERKLQNEKEKEAERLEEEEETRKRDEKERQEHEEYLKLKEAFSVEEEGYDENDEEGDEENKLQIFIQYIKDTKVVVLEDLAAHFKMKTQDAIDRVTTLTEEGQLTGVIDDRGKFIYISQTELEAVAKFITQRGRVSISELAENSNRLVTLNTTT
jgi:hypothetical protein